MRPTTTLIRTTVIVTCLLAVAGASLGAGLTTTTVLSHATGPSPLETETEDVKETTTDLMTNVSWVDEALATAESAGQASIDVRADDDSIVFPANVTYNVTGGTAGPEDVSGGDGTLTFEEAGQVRTVTLGIRGDDVDEGDETVELTLSTDDPHVTFDVRNHTHVVVDDDEANAPPTASDATFEVEEGSSTSASLPGYDPDGDDLFWEVTIGPHRGSLALDPATGEFTYGPETGYVGEDALYYRVTDGTFFATGQVDIIVVPAGDAGTDGATGAGDGTDVGDGTGAGDGVGDGVGASDGNGSGDGGAGASEGAAAAAQGAMWWLVVGTVALVACGGALGYGYYRSQHH